MKNELRIAWMERILFYILIICKYSLIVSGGIGWINDNYFRLWIIYESANKTHLERHTSRIMHNKYWQIFKWSWCLFAIQINHFRSHEYSIFNCRTISTILSKLVTRSANDCFIFICVIYCYSQLNKMCFIWFFFFTYSAGCTQCIDCGTSERYR